MRSLNDGHIYRRLVALHDELLMLAEDAISPRAETALRAAAGVLRRLASALYKASN